MAADDLIQAYLIHLRERSCTQRTVDSYSYHLTAADQALQYGLDVATEEELRAWLWRGTYALSSRALAHAAVVGFFRWAVAKSYLDWDPTTEIPRPKVQDGVPRVATDEQARLVLTDAKQPYRLWAQLAAYAGARCIEIHRLRREHITAQAITIYGKGGKQRSVPTHPLIWTAVRHLPAGPIADAPHEQAISNRFGRYCEVRYHMRLTLHRLRGWFATSGYNASKDPRAIQVLLGHSNLATTTRYIAAAVPQQRAVVDGLPTFAADDAEDDAATTETEPPEDR